MSWPGRATAEIAAIRAISSVLFMVGCLFLRVELKLLRRRAAAAHGMMGEVPMVMMMVVMVTMMVMMPPPPVGIGMAGHGQG